MTEFVSLSTLFTGDHEQNLGWSHPSGEETTGELFSFEGRINRATYWRYWAILFIGNMISLYLTVLAYAEYDPYWGIGPNITLLAVAGVISLALIVPSLSVSVRRWHDLDKSGWWVLVSVVPIVGALYAFIMNGFVAGTPGHNTYGPPTRATVGPEDAAQSLSGTSMSDQTRNRLLAISLMLSMTGFTMFFATVLIYWPWYYGKSFGFDHILALIAIGVGIIFSGRLFDVMSPSRVALVSSGVAALATLFMVLSVETGWGYRYGLFDIALSSALVICALLVILSVNAVSAQLSEYDPRRVSFEAIVVAPVFGSLFLSGFMSELIGLVGGLGLAFILSAASFVIQATVAPPQVVEAGFVSVPNAEKEALV